MFLAGSGIADVQTDQPFRILIANFSDRMVELLPQQEVSTASAHPQTVFDSHLSHEEVLSLIHDDRET